MKRTSENSNNDVECVSPSGRRRSGDSGSTPASSLECSSAAGEEREIPTHSHTCQFLMRGRMRPLEQTSEPKPEGSRINVVIEGRRLPVRQSRRKAGPSHLDAKSKYGLSTKTNTKSCESLLGVKAGNQTATARVTRSGRNAFITTSKSTSQLPLTLGSKQARFQKAGTSGVTFLRLSKDEERSRSQATTSNDGNPSRPLSAETSETQRSSVQATLSVRPKDWRPSKLSSKTTKSHITKKDDTMAGGRKLSHSVHDIPNPEHTTTATKIPRLKGSTILVTTNQSKTSHTKAKEIESLAHNSGTNVTKTRQAESRTTEPQSSSK